jgi:hypothetical protein
MSTRKQKAKLKAVPKPKVVEPVEPQVKLNLRLIAQFEWPTEPLNEQEVASRKLNDAVLQAIVKKVLPISNAMLVALLEAQSKQYITEQPCET